jgi:hypothetical protein
MSVRKDTQVHYVKHVNYITKLNNTDRMDYINVQNADIGKLQ